MISGKWRQQRCADCVHRIAQGQTLSCAFLGTDDILPHQPACAFWALRPRYLAPIPPHGPALETIALRGYVELKPRNTEDDTP
jgi:hypothetical protein